MLIAPATQCLTVLNQKPQNAEPAIVEGVFLALKNKLTSGEKYTVWASVKFVGLRLPGFHWMRMGKN